MESNDTSPTTPTHRAQYPSISSDLPSPQPFRLLFGGVTASDMDPGNLSKFHVLENDGHFSEEESELSNIRQSLGGLTKFTEMMKSGLAAVSLKISDLNPNVRLGATSQLSGFRLGKDTIITSAHFTKWPTTWEAFEALARQYVSGEKGMFEARQERKIKQSGVQFKTFDLKLVALHLPWDLAVFSIMTRPSGDDGNETISQDQIMFVDQSHELSSYKDWWSVGYNSLHDESPGTRNMIKQQHRYNESIPPPMASFLKADRRTVSFGKIKYSQELREKASSCFINLSAWHGRSGGMVCSQANGIVKVWGVVAGGNAERDPNTMVLFTEEMKEWFIAAVFERQDDLDKDYCEFLKCFVMSTSGVAATKEH
ncbi:hypothetical protein LTS15_011195 [Exophiala xenobiotica]|nr:hypothetical protein LTS15_011195 [Exophiala xenobiotica]